MATNSSASSSAGQLVATVRHENLQLQKRLAEMRHENLTLKRQLFHMSGLLDIAVSKLATKGITLETPFGIRELRAAVSRQDILEAPSDTAAELSYEKGAAQSSANRNFKLRQELRGHTKPVQCAAFAPGEQLVLATGGLDARVLLQDFLTGERLLDINGHEQNVSDVAWFEGSGNLLSASFDGTVRLWDPRHTSAGGGTSPVYQFGAAGFVLAVVPLDKAFVFACTDSKRRTSIVDIRVPKPITWKHDVRANTLAVHTAQSQLITGHNNGTIAVWDVRRAGVVLSSSAIDTDFVSSNPQTPGPGSFASPSLDEPPVQRIGVIENEPSQSAVTYLAHYHNRDDTRRLVVVSMDNMVRLYRGGGIKTAVGGDVFTLRNVVGGVPTRGYTVKAAFWKGFMDKQAVPGFYDDGERENEPPARRLTECDLMVTCGAENTACIYDVTERSNATLLERLEGHRDRVVGAAFHHANSKPIIATYSADSTVKIWAPVKS